MADVQPSSKRMTRLMLTALILFTILSCIGLPVITLVPSLARAKLWDTFKLQDTYAGFLFIIGATSAHLAAWPKYAQAWKTELLRRWKVALGLGGVFLIGGFLGMSIVTVQLTHPQGNEDVAAIIFGVCTAFIISGLGLAIAGYINLLMAVSAQSRATKIAQHLQQNSPPTNI